MWPCSLKSQRPGEAPQTPQAHDMSGKGLVLGPLLHLLEENMASLKTVHHLKRKMLDAWGWGLEQGGKDKGSLMVWFVVVGKQ